MNRSTGPAATRSAGAVLAAALAIGLGACGSSSTSGSQPPAGSTGTEQSPASAVTPTFEIDAVEGMKYQLPAGTAPAGAVKVTLVNKDEDMAHEAEMFRLHAGVTPAQFRTALLSAAGVGAAAQLSDAAGGPAAIGPGHSDAVTTVLQPSSTYMVICEIPGMDGKPHYQHGMITSFTTGSTGAAKVPAAGDNRVVLKDFSFTPSAAVDWSKPVQVVNQGTQPHQMQVFGAAPGKTLADVETYLKAPPGTAPAGPPPYLAYGGVSAMAPGASQLADLSLPPGSYLLVCFVDDPTTHLPHFMMGMQLPITVT
ncbi:MAG: hypothetical protein ACRDTP_11000 [Mycobacteriales bacterium]